MDDVEELRRLQRGFVHERDWEQFHTPKNVAMALGGEVGELAEAISRLNYDEVRDRYDAYIEVSDEVGDVTLYLLRLHDLLDLPFKIDVNFANRLPRSPGPGVLPSAVFRLMASVGRILESYQWMAGDEPLGPEARQQVVKRLAVASRNLIAFCALLEINPIAAAAAKLEKNRQKYPVEASRGTSRKYTEIRGD